MFVLVRWELIVHDDYPWIIPRWVEITGIPLHLLTIKNLKIIGSKLGHIDTVELSKGRMLIDVDSGKPLVFSKKILSPGGEEMSINVTYNKLFKHCTSCGMMTHELSNGRRRILDRVVRCRDQASLLWFSHPLVHQLDSHCCENRGLKKGKQGGKRRKYKPVLNHFGSRYAPCDKKNYQPWRIKNKTEMQVDVCMDQRESYAPKLSPFRIGTSSRQQLENPHVSEASNSSGKRLVIKIVTPLRQQMDHDNNVTKRRKSVVCAVTFSTTENVLPDIVQINKALNDMEIVDLMNIEEGARSLVPVIELVFVGLARHARQTGASSAKNVVSSGIPFGLQSKKAEFLRRGCSRKHTSSSKNEEQSRHHHHKSSKCSKVSSSSSNANGLEGSKNTS
ncbi:hypothetical protein N665_0218s0052 [Sinapis alba]|nr:hypothetical protein N665_0218s0052 [Sinapis alba]